MASQQTEFQSSVRLRSVGGSMCVTIPLKAIEALNIKGVTLMDLTVIGGEIRLRAPTPKYTLTELLQDK